MDADQILAFRLARSGLAARDAKTLAAAAACPASDFSRDAALLALGARLDGLTREAYDEAGNVQPLEAPWNLGGYANNEVHRVPVTVLAD